MDEEQPNRHHVIVPNIVPNTLSSPDQWPEHLLKTFRQISLFNNIEIATFLTSGTSISPARRLWRSETIERAKDLSERAGTTIGDAPSAEMEWRLRLETQALERMTMLPIDCSVCRGKFWRSEVEAMVEIEIPGGLADGLYKRREKRFPCCCPPENRLSNLNRKTGSRLLSTRADEMLSRDLGKSYPETGENFPEYGKTLRNRRPDRIIGFQQTSSLNEQLCKYTQMACVSQNVISLKTLLETVNSTVLNHKGNALLFPFLIIEAKARNGGSFEECHTQTAMPILRMLQLQEELQATSQITLEYGRPLVWYLACKGEEWLLRACYLPEKSCKNSFDYSALWIGRLDNEDRALQLLLIIDYIFDWTRDIYRASLIRQLDLVGVTEEHFGQDGIMVAHKDSDDWSLNNGENDMEHNDKWDPAVEDCREEQSDEEMGLVKWATHDSSLGVFRPACVIESFFQCICIDKTNVHGLLSVIPNFHLAKVLAIKAENILNDNCVLVSTDVLERMEENWTNPTRLPKREDAEEKQLFATITYHVSIAANWELERYIYCLAFDEDALAILHRYSKSKAQSTTVKMAKRLTTSNAENLLRDLKNQSTQQILASAIASKRQQLKPVEGTPSASTCPTYKFVDTSDMHWSDNKAHEVISQVYGWCKKSYTEPREPFLRFSQQLSSLDSTSADPNVASYFPGSESESIEYEQSVLVARYIYPEWGLKSTLSLCLFVVPGMLEPPSKEQLREYLRQSIRRDVVYLLHPCPNTWKYVYKRMRTEKHSQDILNDARLWSSEFLGEPIYSRSSAPSPSPEPTPSPPPPSFSYAPILLTAENSREKRPLEDAYPEADGGASGLGSYLMRHVKRVKAT